MSTWESPPLPSRWVGPAGPAFVGRRREFDVLEEVWTAVTRGARQVVFVGGDAGVGKSRLMQVAATTLHGQGAAVLLGCSLADLSAPYEPFVEPLRSLATALRHGDVSTPEDSTETMVDRLSTIIDADQVEQESRSRVPMYDAVVGAFQAAATQRPVVLVLEDLHWAGSSTLELLTYVVERCAGSRLMILASHRSAPPDRSDDVVDAIASMYRMDGVRRLDLGALDVDDIAEYVVLETGTSPTNARSLATRLRDHTGGNAFYLREVVWDLERDDGLLAAGSGLVRVPESVRDTFRRRLDRLEPGARRLGEIAAIVGDSFALPLVTAAAGLAPAAALDLLHSCVQQGLVVSDRTDPQTYAFVHALARTAVLDSMSPAARAQGHADVASRLEVDFPAAPGRVQRLAHHYAEAHVLGLTEPAVRYLELAGEDARARLAHLEAARLLERAARLAPETDRRDALLLRAADAYRDAGDLACAYGLAREVADQGSAVDRVRAAIVFESASWRTGGHPPTAVDLLTRALRDCPADADQALALRARASLSRAMLFSGAGREAELLGSRCVEEARRLGDPATLAHALEAAVMVLPRPSSGAAQLTRARELREVGLLLGNAEYAVQSASITIMLSYLGGDLAGLERARDDLRLATRLTSSAFHRMELHCYDFGRSFAAGDLERATKSNAALSVLSNELVAGDAEGAVALQGFLLRRETDRVREVAAFVTGDEDPADRWAPGLLALYCELGMRGPARRVLSWLCARLSTYSDSSTWPATMSFMADAAVLLEDRNAARTIAGPLGEFSGSHLAVGALVGVFGSADRHLGRVQSMLGSRLAGDLLADAVEQERAMGAPLFTGYALAALSTHLRGTSPRRPEATGLRAEALEIARALSLPRLLRELGDTAGSWPDGLTAREVEVLRLLCDGVSNRELARRLFISENTATNHVRSILLKTGSDNRTQAARYAAVHRLVDPP